MKQKMISMLLATSLSLFSCISGMAVLNVNCSRWAGSRKVCQKQRTGEN